MQRLARVVVLVLALLGARPVRAQPADAEGASGPTRNFNDYVVRVIHNTALFPRGGDYGGATDDDKGRGLVGGVTQALRYTDADDKKFEMKPLASGATNCSGVTFQVFFEAYKLYAAETKSPMLNHLSVGELRSFMAWWFRNFKNPDLKAAAEEDGTPVASEGPSDAIDRFGLGKKIHHPNDAQPGDFMQWGVAEELRGHTVVFLGWVDDEKDEFRYFSSNSSEPTGIQVATKKLSSLKDWWFARVVPPPPPAPPAAPPEGEAPAPAPAPPSEG